MSAWTQEPWLPGNPVDGYSHDIADYDGEIGEVAELPLADYDRAIVCVNACRIFTTATLEAGAIHGLMIAVGTAMLKIKGVSLPEGSTGRAALAEAIQTLKIAMSRLELRPLAEAIPPIEQNPSS